MQIVGPDIGMEKFRSRRRLAESARVVGRGERELVSTKIIEPETGSHTVREDNTIAIGKGGLFLPKPTIVK